MKRAKPGKRKVAVKGGISKNFAEYVEGFPPATRGHMKKIRAAIRSAAPKEAIEIISYRMPAFKHKKVLVWYGAFSDHCSLFPTASVVEAMKDELKGFSASKGTIHFPLSKPVPTMLIQKLVKVRVAQSESKR